MAEERGTHLGCGANSERTEDRTNGFGSEVGLQTEDRTMVGFMPVVGPQREDRTGGDCESDVVLPRERRCGLIERMKMFNIKEFLTWRLVKTVVMGQGLAALICGTAITSQYLATEHQVDAPMLQSFLNYALLCLTYTTTLLFRRGDGNILQILRRRWWKYVLVGLVDVEANYAVVKAYQFTTLTSIQLLDSFVIPILMVLSWFALKTRYKPVHYVAVCICLLGVGAMVGADLLAGRDQGSTSNILLGDGLVLVSASLYAVSNVCQEYTVKNLGRVQFLGMMGLFGTLISGAQMLILERESIAGILWNWRVGLLFSGYGLCMYTLYSCMPVVVKMTSATSVNLSLLTADIFALFCGLFLFHYTFSGLYIMSLVLIIIGFVTFNAVPTPSDPADTPDPSDPTAGYDNPAPVFNHDVPEKDVVANVPSEDQPKEEQEESARAAGLSCQPPAEGGIVARSEGRSTKM